ncbi:hypothetical protein BOTBODRAFT_25707 [Botryobasidium botryosum FD-172 SS1]|uniref:Cytochrome P450 n=1 Tax=Botryobasidium botryosum (strain FD-172 SS1) TaxID=930990 RepID=A0A067N098_BOTB1|nr:hypothetical protein BOTBODRAFT_25707 [Botryobasidium botryosum FD-172 SS1]
MSTLSIALGGLVAVFLVYRWQSTRGLPPLPPGPKPLPIIGNAHQYPHDNESAVFSEWSKIYGNVMSVTLFGQTIVIINDIDTAVDMLENPKRSEIYSGRPASRMAQELVGWDEAAAMLQYGDVIRQHRKNLNQALSTRAVARYWTLQVNEARACCARHLETPDRFRDHIRRTMNAVILSVTYGHHVTSDDDPLVALGEQCMNDFSDAAMPGAFLVDVIPALKYVPAWFPGAGFQRQAAIWRKRLLRFIHEPMETVKKNLANGTQTPCFVTDLLETVTSKEEEERLKWSAVNIHAGGSGTSHVVLSSFYLAMTVTPEVQRKAQAEIDRVIGQDRLPRFEDRGDLPYANAILKEVMRWQPVSALGLPRRTSKEDVYNGYYIPKGALVLYNTRAMCYDPSVFKDPHRFMPERFLEADGKTPVEMSHAREWGTRAFGYGRRSCAGMHLANETLFINIVTALATLNISKGVDESGTPIEPDLNYLPGVINHPKPWKCKIEARSPRAAALLREAVESAVP